MSDAGSAIDTQRLRIVLADDQQLVRRGFRLILESEPGVAVVAEAADGAGAVDAAARHRPDVVLMDIQMPGMDGLEATRRITEAGTRVVVLTTFERDDYILDAVRAGASGYLLKSAPPEDLLDALRAAVDGAARLSPSVTRRVLDRLAAEAPVSASARQRLDELTEREIEVLGLLATGRSNAEIAERLVLGEATVKSHVSRVLSKLHLRDRVQAVVFAYESGVVRPSGRDPAAG
jgi:DNA-binding NarL/FixJ family response regulator